MSKQTTVAGEFLLLGTCLIEGLSPIIARYASSVFPPVLFVAISIGLAMLIMAALMTVFGQWNIPFKRVAGDMFMVAASVLVGFGLIFVGAQYTSSINVALLGQTEMLFAFLLCNLVLGEATNRRLALGAMAVFFGTLVVIFNGTLQFNAGDLIILLASFLFPIGNRFAKRALRIITPLQALFMRYLFGVPLLLLLSFIVGDYREFTWPLLLEQRWLIVAYVVLVLTFSKIFWYSGLKVLPVGKATQIVSSAPAFSLLFSALLLREFPTEYQILGFMLTMLGVYLLVSRASHSTRELDLV